MERNILLYERQLKSIISTVLFQVKIADHNLFKEPKATLRGRNENGSIFGLITELNMTVFEC